MHVRSRVARWWWPSAIVVALALWLLQSRSAAPVPASPPEQVLSAGVEATPISLTPSSSDPFPRSLETACSACHRLPSPALKARAGWSEEIEKMYQFAAERDIQLECSLEDAVTWYESRAPLTVPPAPERTDAGPGDIVWARSSWRHPEAPQTTDGNPTVANVALASLSGDRMDLIVCDMRFGAVLALDPADLAAGHRILGRVPFPGHAEVCDLDRDGHRDLLVADLGTYYPSDEALGQVVWLRGLEAGGFETRVVARDLGRVTDVRAADFDRDGDLDLAVAEFGWRKIGRVLCFHNDAPRGESPHFRPFLLDGRHGAIHVPTADLDLDGDLDIAGVLSQESEQVMAYLWEGRTFRSEILFEAPHPAWGYSGLEVADLDTDGDPDILVTNGDLFDDSLPKPWHSVAALENLGAGEFRYRELTPMYGVYRAVPADLDCDGDLDIVAAALVPELLRRNDPEMEDVEALLWLERTGPWEYRRRVLERGNACYATLAAADFDADGRTDLALGHFVLQIDRTVVHEPWVTVWRNLGPPAEPGATSPELELELTDRRPR